MVMRMAAVLIFKVKVLQFLVLNQLVIQVGGAIAFALMSVHCCVVFWPSHFKLNERASRC